MINALSKLGKLVKINYYKDSIKLIEKPCHIGGLYNSVNSEEIKECVFSKSKLIDGKYHFIQRCVISDFIPEYRTSSIDVLDLDHVKSEIISKIPLIIKRKVKSFNIDSFKLKNNEYLHKCIITEYNGCAHELSYRGFNYTDSKILLFNEVVHLLNRIKNENRKKSV